MNLKSYSWKWKYNSNSEIRRTEPTISNILFFLVYYNCLKKIIHSILQISPFNTGEIVSLASDIHNGKMLLLFI